MKLKISKIAELLKKLDKKEIYNCYICLSVCLYVLQRHQLTKFFVPMRGVRVLQLKIITSHYFNKNSTKYKEQRQVCSKQ